MASECPKCGEGLGKARWCRTCGWGRMAKKADQNAEVDPMHGCCEWRADGKRCRFPGTISRNTNGTGPWYCSAHDSCSPTMGAAIVEQSMDLDGDYSLDERRAYGERRWRREWEEWQQRVAVAGATPGSAPEPVRDVRHVGAAGTQRVGGMPRGDPEAAAPARGLPVHAEPLAADRLEAEFDAEREGW